MCTAGSLLCDLNQQVVNVERIGEQVMRETGMSYQCNEDVGSRNTKHVR